MLELATYKPSWPEEFQQIAKHMRRALSTLALRIDHIGSTAVSGLAAKDIIDVQITVDTFDHRVRESLHAIGYAFDPCITKDHRPAGESGPDTDWNKWFFRAPAGQRPTNTHVRCSEASNQRYALLFRDYLRSHPATADSYGQLKRNLARELRDPNRYADVKDAAVDLIYHAAKEWALVSSWQMGLSDQ